jgi:hypothetical protein
VSVCFQRCSLMRVSTCGYIPIQNTYVHVVVILQLLLFEPTNTHNFTNSQHDNTPAATCFRPQQLIIREHTAVQNSCLRLSTRSYQKSPRMYELTRKNLTEINFSWAATDVLLILRSCNNVRVNVTLRGSVRTIVAVREQYVMHILSVC